MTLQITNTSPFRTAQLRRWVARVWPCGLDPFPLHLTVQACADQPFSGFVRADQGHLWVSVGPATHFPCYDGSGGLQCVCDPAEAVVGVLAHELRHCWQYRTHGRALVGDAVERDADRYGRAVIEAYRARWRRPVAHYLQQKNPAV